MNPFATFHRLSPAIKHHPISWASWLPALLLLACAPLFAQVPVTAWTRSYNGPRSGWDITAGLVTDAAGNVYVTGESASTTSDYLTIKYSPFGGTLWTQRYNGPANGTDVPAGIAIDALGNVYVTGTSDGGGTRQDFATLKYSPSGTLLWERRINEIGSGDDQAVAIAIDAAGNVLVTGSSQYISGSFNDMDYRTVKYDASGNVLWNRVFNGNNSNDNAKALATDAAGNVYVTGSSSNNFKDGGSDFATLKYDASGNRLWVRRYNYEPVDFGESSYDRPNSIAVDGSGKVYVVGTTYFGGYFTLIQYDAAGVQQWVINQHIDNGSLGPPKLAVFGTSQVYLSFMSWVRLDVQYQLQQYSPDGVLQWERIYRETNPYTSTPTPRGATGYLSTMKLDASGNVYMAGTIIYSWGSTDAKYTLIKYDPAGSQLWLKRYDSPVAGYNYHSCDLAVDGNGNVYLTGFVYRDDVSGGDDGLDLDYNYLTVKYTPPVTRINSGGPAVATSWGVFSADSYFTGLSTNRASTPGDIAGTTDDAIYPTWREASADGGSFAYNIPVFNGTYRVSLHFAELFHTAANRRVFNVNLEGGSPELTNWDVFAAAGASRATIKTYSVRVIDGQLNIEFTSLVGKAMIAAIEAVWTSAAREGTEPIETLAAPLSLSAHPNPFEDRLTLQVGQAINPVAVTMVDLLGRVTHQALHQPVGGEIELWLPQLQAGVYLVRVQTGEGTPANLRVVKR